MTNLTKEEQKNQLLQGLNNVQKEAVLHTEGPLLILAGAGSGKTRVITHRIAYLVQCEQIRPSEIMAITFTNKAANEMKERAEQLLGFNGRGMWIGTFHSMMLRLLRQHAARIGFTPNFTILDTDDQQRLLKEILKEMNIDENLLNAKTAQHKISNMKNRMQDWHDLEKESRFNQLNQQLSVIFKTYQERMKRANSMDFDDILNFAVLLLEENSDVLDAYQTRFKHIMVDEYQDTNYVQYRLVKLLSGKYKNICVVGDDDQSIYSFRGANIENILNFEKDFKNSKVIKLEQNYRSTQTILGAANAVIRQNEERTDKKLWTDGAKGDFVRFYLADTQYDEARYVATEIRQLINRRDDPIAAGNIGVLYRVNALSRNLEFALREQGILYNIYGGLRFYDRKEIKDFLAYMRVVFSENDELALTRIINVPKRGIGNRTIEEIRAIAAKEQIPMMQVLVNAAAYPELSRSAAKLNEFVKIIAELRTLIYENELSFAEFCREIQERSGLLQDLLEQKEQNVQDATSRIENLQEIISDAIEYEQKVQNEITQFKQLEQNYDLQSIPDLAKDEEDLYAQDISLASLTKGFLEQTTLYSDLDQDQAENTVRLMAIHSAKGLEFDAVFIIGLEESIFPGYRSFDSPEQLEEERRLAYVGITRARKYLHMTAARSRLLYGQTKYNLVSRFMSEIPSEYIREIGGSRANANSSDVSNSALNNQFNSYSGSVKTYRSGSNIPGRNQYDTENSDFKSKILGSFGLQNKPQNTYFQNSGLDVAKIKINQKYKHKKFGIGIIKKIDYVAGDAILTLNFSGAIKRMMASSAPLTKVEND